MEKRLFRMKEDTESRFTSVVKILKQLGDNSEKLAVVLSRLGVEMTRQNDTEEVRRRMKALSQRLDSMDEMMSHLSQRHGSLLEIRREDVIKRDKLRAHLGQLSVNVSRASSDIEFRLDALTRLVVDTKPPNLTVRKGYWTLRRAKSARCSHGYESRILRAKFAEGSFAQRPVVFYSIKSYRQSSKSKRFPSYKINNELITDSGLSAHIFFFNCVPFLEMTIEYIAIGVAATTTTTETEATND